MSSPRPNLAWIAFLTVAFGIVGLTGLFATYATPLPLERALMRDAALDEALVAAQSPDPEPALAALRERLGESAAAIEAGPLPLPERIQTERSAMRARFSNEAAAIEGRLRLLIVIVTMMAAGFGAVLLGGLARK